MLFQLAKFIIMKFQNGELVRIQVTGDRTVGPTLVIIDFSQTLEPYYECLWPETGTTAKIFEKQLTKIESEEAPPLEWKSKRKKQGKSMDGLGRG